MVVDFGWLVVEGVGDWIALEIVVASGEVWWWWWWWWYI